MSDTNKKFLKHLLVQAWLEGRAGFSDDSTEVKVRLAETVANRLLSSKEAKAILPKS
jgi:hypothetical protein